MSWQNSSIIWPFLLAAITALVFALIFAARRSAPGSAPLAICMAGVSVWMLCFALSMSVVELPTILFWHKAMHLGLQVVPVSFLVFTLQYTGQGQRFRRRNLALLAVFPVLTLLVIWTNDLHHLFWQRVWLQSEGPFLVMRTQRGIWAWLTAAYAYGLSLVSLVILNVTVLRSPRLFRRQAASVLLAEGIFLVIALFNTADVTGLADNSVLRWAPLGVVLVGLALLWGVAGVGLFDLVPVARARVVEGMADGFIVLDGQDRLVDLNPSAQCILELPTADAIGRPATEVFTSRPAMVEILRHTTTGDTELALVAGTAQRNYSVRAFPLRPQGANRRGESSCSTMITERKRAEAELLVRQQTLAALEERERLAREMHDSVAQVLGYIATQTLALRQHLASGDTGAADTQLARLAQVTQEAYADVRDYISSVRSVTTERPFVAALQEYAERFGENYGIDTMLSSSENLTDVAFPIAFSSELMHIVKEALTNVRKHAAAYSAKVRVERSDGHIEICVQDDGRGYDPGRSSAGDGQHFGTRIMAERAARLGGTLEIRSAPGQGTRVTVRVPASRAM